MGKRAVIGLPIQLMTRLLAGGINIGGAIGGAVGGALGSKVGRAVGAVTSAAAIAVAVVPGIIDTMNKDANKDADDLGTRVNPLEALITFFDLNANVLDIDEARRLAIVDVPGREGDFIQNLGSKSVKYRLTGRFFAVDPKDTNSTPFSPIFKTTFDNNTAVGNTQLLRLLERTGVPAPFMCEYDIAEVIISRVQLKQDGGKPGWINYTIDLIEYRRLPQIVKMLGLAGLGMM